MKCQKCGTEFPDNIAVCPSCGTVANLADASKQQRKASQPMPFNGQATPVNAQPMPFNGQLPPNTQQSGKNFKLTKKMIYAIAGGGVALVALIIFIIVMALQPKKINLEDYVKISYDGYDGYATADVYLDETSLYKDILEANGESMSYSSWSDIASGIKNASEIEKAVRKIKLKVKADDGNISNGDTIKVTLSYDNDAAKECKVKFKGEEVKKKVSGLDEVEEIDPFEGLEVSFEGTSPNGNVSYEYNGESDYLSYYSYTAEKYDGLRNGDTVTISIKDEDEYTLQNGYVFKPKEKEYKVEGLDEYAESYSALTEDFVNTLKQDSEDIIYSYTSNSYNAETTMSDLSYAGYIFLAIKDGNSYSDANDLYLIYKGTVTNSQGKFDTTDVYYPVKFANILIEGEDISTKDSGSIVGSTSFSDSWNSTKGYTNPLTCYMDIVEKNSEDYNSECGGGFESNSKYSKVSLLSEITKEGEEALNAAAKTVVENYISQNYSDKVQVTDLNAVGMYFLSAKATQSDYADDTILYVVYSGTVTHTEGSFDTATVYYPVEYRGIFKLESGEYKMVETNGIAGSSSFSNSWYYTKGYLDGKTMFDKLVNTKRTSYKYEVSSGLESFGK